MNNRDALILAAYHIAVLSKSFQAEIITRFTNVSITADRNLICNISRAANPCIAIHDDIVHDPGVTADLGISTDLRMAAHFRMSGQYSIFMNMCVAYYDRIGHLCVPFDNRIIIYTADIISLKLIIWNTRPFALDPCIVFDVCMSAHNNLAKYRRA